MIVLHQPKRAVDHRVLKVTWPIHCRDLAGEALPDAKVFRIPRHALPNSHQSASYAPGSYGSLSAMNISCQVYLNASCEVKAAFDWRVDNSKFIKRNHSSSNFLTRRPLPRESGYG